jgi:hypothetical protein
MQIRPSVSDSQVLMELTSNGLDGRIIITYPVTGTIDIVISATDTAAITWATGVYDLELVSSGGEVTRLIEGKIKVSKEVTR